MSSNDCPRCGTTLAPGTKFCSECGNDLTSVGPAVGGSGPGGTAKVSTIDVEATLLEFLKQATVGEFEIIKELGRGGMAMVYLAKDLSLARDVAVKVMSPSLSADASMAERFVREAQTAASLSHPNIIPVYAVRQTASITFFVMKYITGRPLDDIMDEVGPMPIDLTAAILSQVAGALGYGHKRGIVHRDVKPGNVMIDDEGWAVVTDFGIAKVDQAEGLTQTGAAIGTPTYMSPEQCTAKEVKGASDQYSLGVVAYEMLTGKKPFDGDSVMSIMYAHVNEPPPPFLDVRPDCPRDLHDAIMKMLEKKPEDRYADLDDLVADLSRMETGDRGDSARTEMISLAQSGVTSNVIGKVRTPRSPMPLESLQKSAVQSGTVRPSAETLKTPVPAGALDSGQLVDSGKVQPAKKGAPMGLIAAAAVIIIGVTGAFIVRPWETAEPAEPPPVVNDTPQPSNDVTVQSITIDAPGNSVVEDDELPLTATVTGSDGSTMSDAVTWETGDRNIATVDNAGFVVARAPGRVTITASLGGQTADFEVTVTARPADAPPPEQVASVTVSPGSAQITVGESATVRATVRGNQGSTMQRSVTWSSNNEAVATVSNGRITGVSAGTATITASRNGFRDQVTVQVADVAVASVTVSVDQPSLTVGATTSASVTVRAGDGSQLQGRDVTLQSSNPAVATVSGGSVSAVGAGSADIIASAGGQTGRVTVTVAAPEPTGPTEAQSRQAITGLIAAYHSAFSQRDIAAVERAYAGITSVQRDRWSQFFSGAENLQATYDPNPPTVTINGETAEARFETTYRFRAGGQNMNNSFPTVMRFAYRNSNWVMTEWQGGND